MKIINSYLQNIKFVDTEGNYAQNLQMHAENKFSVLQVLLFKL